MILDPTQRPPWFRYLIAGLAVALAAAARVALLGVWGIRFPFVTFYPAVIVAALAGGLRAGMLATCLSALTVAVGEMEPVGQLWIKAPADWIALGIFVSSCVTVCWLIQAMQRAQIRASEAEAQVKLAAERNRTDEQLRRYQLLAENSRDIILHLGRDDGLILEANFAAAKAYGYSREELQSLSIRELRAADALELTADQMAAADATGILFETLHLRKDGTAFPVEVSSQGATIEGVRTLISVIRDITERKRAEEELRQQREWLRVTLTSIGDAVLAAGADCRITFLNSVATQLTGWSEPQALGRPIQEVFRIINELTREPAEDIAGRVMRDGSVVSLANHTSLLTRDGREVPIEDSAAPIRDAGGSVAGVVIVFHEVTSQRRAQMALREERERLRMALDASHSGIWEWDLRTNENFWSAELWKLYGLEPHSCTPSYDAWRQVILPEDRPMAEREVQAAAKNGTELNVEFRVRGPEGEERWLMSTGQPVRDADGHAVRYTGIVVDITVKKRAEEARRESEARFLRLVRLAPIPLCLVNRDGELSYANDRFIETFGYSHDDIPTLKDWWRLAYPDDSYRRWVEATWNAAVRRASDTNADIEPIEYEVTCKDGTVRDVVISGITLEDSYLVTMIDITGRKQAEARLVHSNAVLAARNEIHRQAMNCETEEELCRRCLAVAEGLTKSKFGIIEEINAQGRVDGITVSDAGWDIKPCAGEAPGGCAIHDIYERVRLEGRGCYTNDPAAHRGHSLAEAGDPLLTAFLCVPLQQDGRTIGRMAVGNRDGGYRAQDLEALEDMALGVVNALMRKRAEKAVRAGEERLRQAQKAESLGVLAGGVAHDFNNLLVGVVGNASLALEWLPSGSPAAELLEGVLTTGEQLAHLTRQMLAYSGKGRFVVERLNLSHLLPEMSSLAHRSIPKRVPLHLELAQDLPMVEADRGQLQQIIVNLVVNAAEAIGSGEGLITVRTGVQQVDDRYVRDHPEAAVLVFGEYVCLEVRDNGCGMDESTKSKVFDPFFSTKFLGRGLGLAAVAGIVRGHGGAIVVSSAPGQGSTFTVLFPASGRAPGATVVSTDRGALFGSGTVLIVDDEEIVRTMAKKALERYGYQVIAAESGTAALDTLKRHPGEIAAVILDLSMPGMSGEEALPAMRGIRPDIKVLISSGYSESETMRLFEGQRVSGFIQKPYTTKGIAEKLKTCLE